MRTVYAVIMLSCSVIAFFYATRIIYNKNYKKKINLLFTLVSFASGLWSLGYGLMFIQADNTEAFATARSIGIVGLILFINSGQLLLAVISGRYNKLRHFFVIEDVIGILVFVAVLSPANYSLEITDNGIITHFNYVAVDIFYTVYCVAIAAVYAVIAIHMIRRNKSKRVQAFGKSCLKIEGLIAIGMIIDTLLPSFDINFNIPASTILQFFGLEIMYFGVHRYNRNQISMENMTGYIYNSLKSPILILDTNHKIKLMNKDATSMFGFSENETENMPDFWGGLFNAEIPKNIADAENTILVDALYEKKGIHCRLYIDLIYNEYKDNIGYIVFITDMTENIKNMEAIKNAKEEAEAANLTKSLFLANMSHEIRTPMNSILGFSEVALGENIDETSREYFKDINSSAKILLTTINDILDISKIESGKMEINSAPYHTDELFKEVSTIIGMQASKKNLEFNMNISEDFASVLSGDKDRIREILINLLNNGIKYTKSGSVSLNASVISRTETTDRICFTIKDTGIGIKEEDIEHIFDTFRRVDAAANRHTEGTGLGLSITKGYIELMNGTIRVESTYGKGSAFIAEIDQEIIDSSPVSSVKKESSKTESDDVMFRDISIIAVDDNLMNLKLIKKILSVHGIEIDTAKSGMEAIEMCNEKFYDIVLMDHMMPQMDGVEAMKHIRSISGYENGGKSRIIALTANTVNGVREQMVEYGFDDFLGKPIDIKEMEKMFVGMLDENKYYYK